MEDASGQPAGDGSWGCPNKPYGIHGATLKSWFSNAITTLHGYSGIAGIDLAEPQWGPSEGGGACWCSSCQAAFAAAHPGHTFGEASDSQAADNPTPSVTVWEQWRGDVLTAADLRPYLKNPLVCPLGGRYIIGPVGRPPRCSLPEHSLAPPASQKRKTPSTEP